MARPRLKLNLSDKELEQMKTLARCHCPDSEIAAYIGCSESTLARRFGPLLKECREAGRANLRAKQYQLALAGNVPLLIWVGKQILGQREVSKLTLEQIPDDVLAQDAERRLNGTKNQGNP